VVGTIDEGQARTKMHGHEVAVSPDGRTVYMPIYGDVGVGKPGLDGHEMIVIDLQSGKITGRVDFGHGVRPHLPVYDRAKNLLYVTTELDKAVTIVDPKTLKILGKVPTGAEQSHMLAVSRDGRRGYTSNVEPGGVSVLDLQARKVVKVIPVAGKAQRIALSADERWLFTSDNTAPRMAVIDTRTNAIAQWIELPGLGYGSAATADGKWLLVPITDKDLVAVVDLGTMKVARTIKVVNNPQEMLIAPDGKTAYVAGVSTGKVAVIDLGTWAMVRTIDVGPRPDGLGWAGQ
jgi:DNA-binding beta-propeller fold protein YncE